MLALTRTQLFIAYWAAVAAEMCHSLVLPSAAGTLTGHMNSTPVRVIAVNRVAKKHSPCSSGTAPRSTM